MPRGGKPGRKPKSWATEDARMAEAVRLRCQGLSYDAIAKKVGYADRSGAFNAIHSLLKQRQAEAVDELRRLWNERADELLATFHPKALEGDPEAATVVVRLLRESMKVNGLAAPIKTEITGPAGGPIAVEPVAITPAKARSVMASIFGEMATPKPAGSEDAGGERDRPEKNDGGAAPGAAGG